jgi:vacuolar-type H+-ATPase subunit C/Vma6
MEWWFQDLDDMNIEIMRNTLYKAYLEDFYKFCQVFAVHMVFTIGSDFIGVFVLLWY